MSESSSIPFRYGFFLSGKNKDIRIAKRGYQYKSIAVCCTNREFKKLALPLDVFAAVSRHAVFLCR